MEMADKRIVVTGGSGFLGSHVVKTLVDNGIPRDNIFVPRSREFDLRFFENAVKATKDANIVIHLAADVGGIGYNKSYPGSIFYNNVKINSNLIEACRINDVEKTVLIGSVCSYPKYGEMPFKEDSIWNGYPEETNGPYGMSKRLMLVQSLAYHNQYGMEFVNLILANMYGPWDDFSDNKSHVIPALIKRFLNAKRNNKPSVVVWGTGNATRDFLFVEDAAYAIFLSIIKENLDPNPINIASGKETSIRELAETIKELVGYNGDIVFDTSKPDGQPRRVFDISRARKILGFEPRTDIYNGLKATIEWYIKTEGLQ